MKSQTTMPNILFIPTYLFILYNSFIIIFSENNREVKRLSPKRNINKYIFYMNKNIILYSSKTLIICTIFNNDR